MLSAAKSNENSSLNCNGLPLCLKEPKIMGVLNLTPDSFYKVSRVSNNNELLDKVSKMVNDGMDILDLGAVSSRPGATPVTQEEEINRLISPLKDIRKEFPNLIISIDTFRPEVLKRALDSQINILNDISGLKEEDLLNIVTKNNLPYILMHMQGSPETMQDSPDYENVILELLSFFKNRIHKLKKAGVRDVLIDPGFGFGKTQEHNFEILRKLEAFKMLDCPMLVGLSRKSMIHKLLKIDPSTALNGTTALHMVALLNGAKILRVHDVLEAKQCLQLYKVLNGKW